MLGARTLAVLGTAALAVALAFFAGVLDPDYLRDLDAAACLLVGLFASLATVVSVSMWHLDGRSAFAIGWHRGQLVAASADRIGRVARDVPVSVQRLLYFTAFACVGLLSFGPDSAERLANAATILGAGSSDVCADPDAAGLEPATRKRAPAVDQRGCALVRRAFELGYRKNLGNCEPKEAVVDEPISADAAPPCELRQRDEPALHYAWRLLQKRMDAAQSGLGGDAFATARHELRTKLDYLPALTATTREAVLASPRASHHLWTNAPPPKDVGFFERVFGKNRCAARHGVTQPSLDWSHSDRPVSALLDGALGQLLFSPRHGAIAGSCDETTIHWSAPIDACDRLIADPAGVLDDAGALEGVRAVLGRHHSRNRRAALADELGRGRASLRSPDVRRVVSFQCLIAGSDEPTLLRAPTRERTMTIDGARLLVRERRMAAIESSGAGQLDVYRHLAALLAGGRYTGPVTERGVETRRDAPLAPDVLDGDGFSLARLEYLYDADPFLGETWPLERDDLTSVYPFEVHLRHFTEVFRRRYLNVRGRL